MSAGTPEPLGYLVVVERDGPENSVPIFDQLFVGRECPGISPQRRLVIDDPEISRTHVEIRLDDATSRAFVIDTSTNGTSLNGQRLERAVPTPISHDDEIRISNVVLTFHSSRFTARSTEERDRTGARISEEEMVMVVGDVTNYSAIAEVTKNLVIASSLDRLWNELGHILRRHRGTLNHYAGGALYAVWELDALPTANELAIDFALAAHQRVRNLGPQLPLRDPDDSPLRMGWSIVQGMAALAAITRPVEAVIGDSTNVAFRLAGLAGRGGRHAVIASEAVRAAVQRKFLWGKPEQVEVTGRSGLETIFPVIGRTTTISHEREVNL